MVSLIERNNIVNIANSDPSLQAIAQLLDGVTISDTNINSGDIRNEILLSIAKSSDESFKKAGRKIENRDISISADWCNDDFLIFLLILGNYMFGKPFDFLDKIIEARRNNTNSLPQKINEVYSSLCREDFSVRGELGFIKVAFLRLVGKLNLDTRDAKYLFTSLSTPGMFDSLSPFFKVLAIKSYDIVLFERSNFEFESTSKLVEQICEHSKELSIRQLWMIAKALPIKLLFPLFLLFIGYTLFVYASPNHVINIIDKHLKLPPKYISISNISTELINTDLPHEGKVLSRLISDNSSGKNIYLSTKPFNGNERSFVIEIFHVKKKINNALVYVTTDEEIPKSFIIIPIQNSGGNIRAFVPALEKKTTLIAVLNFDSLPKGEIKNINKSIILRVSH